MKSIMNYYLILPFAAAVLLAACDTKEEDINSLRQAEGVPLQLSSGIKVSMTRAFDTTWDIGDPIGVFTTKAGTTTITRSGSEDDANIGYYTTAEAETYSGDSYTFRAFVPNNNASQIYLPADGSAVDVYAYYKYDNTVTASNPLSITIPTTQNSANQKLIDVLKAVKTSTDEAPINIDNPAVALTFEHVMSKVIVYVMSGTGYSDEDLSGSKVSSVQLLGQPTQATFAPISQELSITTDSKTITMEELSSSDPDYLTGSSYTIPGTAPAITKTVLHTYRGIILPNNDTTNPKTSGSERQIKFNVGDTNYTYNLTNTFSPGQQTIFAIRLSATGIDVTAAIKDWSHSSTISPNPLYPQE